MISVLGLIRRARAWLHWGGRASADYRLYADGPQAAEGWKATQIAARQHGAFKPLLDAARNGNARLDFRVAADAIRATQAANPLILEIGCGSGYYSEVLPRLLGESIRYFGLDYSSAMTSLARAEYPDSQFITGDALALPVATESCDIAMSGTSLMHIPEYERAIAEMVRVSRQWCIFHTVPVMSRRGTVMLSKLAYGERVPEIIFNRGELEQLIAQHGLRVALVKESFPYDVSAVVGENTMTLTYLCERTH